jgi:hypothetical protein
LIFVPRVPVGNTENYSVRRSQHADFAQVPVCQDTAVSPAEMARNPSAKRAPSTLFLSGNFKAFHRTETESISTTCEDDIQVRSGKTRSFYRHSWHVNQAYPNVRQGCCRYLRKGQEVTNALKYLQLGQQYNHRWAPPRRRSRPRSLFRRQPELAGQIGLRQRRQ